MSASLMPPGNPLCSIRRVNGKAIEPMISNKAEVRGELKFCGQLWDQFGGRRDRVHLNLSRPAGKRGPVLRRNEDIPVHPKDWKFRLDVAVLVTHSRVDYTIVVPVVVPVQTQQCWMLSQSCFSGSPKRSQLAP